MVNEHEQQLESMLEMLPFEDGGPESVV